MVNLLINFCIGVISAFLTMCLLLLIYYLYCIIMFLLSQIKIIWGRKKL
jgi:hypothetical protein